MRKFLAIAVMLCLSGCSLTTSDPSSPTIKKINPDVYPVVTAAAQLGTSAGLNALVKKNPTVANSIATAASTNISTNILPYLNNGATLLTSAEIETYLQTAMFDKLPDEVKTAVVAAFAVLDLYLPIPDSKTYLTADQIKLISAFFQGVQQGCDEFNSPSRSIVDTSKALTTPSKKWFVKKK